MPSEATWMQLEIIMLSEVSQKEKDRYHMIFFYTWNLKHGINEPIYKIEADSNVENRLLDAKGVGESVG